MKKSRGQKRNPAPRPLESGNGQPWADCSLNEAQKREAVALLGTHAALFAAAPRQSEAANTKGDKELDRLEPAEDPQFFQNSCAAEALVVRRKGSSRKLYCDYRRLNRITIQKDYPLPCILDLNRKVKRSTFFVSLKLNSRHRQIPLDEASRQRTVFRAPQGFFEFNLMPCGLVDAPVALQRAMDIIFGDLHHRGVLVYSEDILIHASTFETARDLLGIVLRRLSEKDLSLDGEKCSFFPKRVKFLGHILCDGRMRPDSFRIEQLRKIRPATSLREIRSILGQLGYFRGFVRNYAEITIPLTDLLQRCTVDPGVPVMWTEVHNAAVTAVINELEKAELYFPS